MTGTRVHTTNLELFPIKSEIALNGSKLALARISDVGRAPTTDFDSFADLLLESEDLYPGIGVWFKSKVVPGLKNGRRVAYALYHEGRAIAESIVKFGAHTKICSMRVDPLYQKKGIGPFLFAQIAREIDYSIKTVHFTAPERLVEERGGLFDDLGFVFQGKSRKKYRPGMDELVFQGLAHKFKKNSIELVGKKIVKNMVGGSRPGILLSIRPAYLQKILGGEKKIELRRTFSSQNKGSVALLYATMPVGKILGDALIEDVVVDAPPIIWKQFHQFLGCSRSEFDDYTRDCEYVSALFLSQISQYPHPFEWGKVMQAFAGVSRPPQSYQYIPLASLSFWGTLASSSFEPESEKANPLSIGF